MKTVYDALKDDPRTKVIHNDRRAMSIQRGFVRDQYARGFVRDQYAMVHILILQRAGKFVTVFTQLPENSGVSVTNCIEILIKKISEEYQIPLSDCLWVERYTGDPRHGDTYDIVALLNPDEFLAPDWQPSSLGEIVYRFIQMSGKDTIC